jgi:hypothetical protein
VKSGLIGLRHVFVLLACLISTPAFAACSVKTTAAASLGTYSPGAVRQGVVPSAAASSGFGCTAAIASILSTDYMRATVSSVQAFKLISTTTPTDTVSYTLAADAAGANPIVAGTAFAYKGPGINLLGLIADVSDVKIYIKPSSTVTVPPGTYKGDFKIDWAWQFCSGLGLFGLCALGSVDSNVGPPAVNATATISVTLVVQDRPVGMVISTRTVWDPQYNTTNPRATPGSRQRTTITVSNLDIATIDANSLKIVLPTPAKGVVALDGDKTPANAVVTTTDGTPTSNLALSYVASDNPGDDVEFSNNTGFALVTEPWSYQPAPGSATAQGAITAVRFKPKGTMAAGSSFSVSMPYSVSLTNP